jgi:hypothetical protein
MDTNQETGVSLEDVAALIEDDQPAEETSEETTAEEVAASDESEAEEEAQEEGNADDSEDVEFEGKTYKVPKELKGALLRQADYTQKTQEVAEQRKALEQKAQLFEAQQRISAQTFDKQVELREIQNRLSQFENMDWQSLVDSDPVQATRLNLAFQQLQQQAARKSQELQQAQSHAEQLSAAQRQQMLNEAQKELTARLPNFSAQTAEKIKTAARSYGLSDQELNNVIDPRYVHVLHDAAKWRALQADKPKAMQKVAEAPRVMKPQAPTTRSEQTTRAINNRFSSGKARINDLAAFLENS